MIGDQAWVTIPVGDARDVAHRVLESRGVPADAAAIQTDLLIEADLRGRPSHGLMRLPRVVERIDNGVTNPGASGSHRWTNEAALHVDGQAGLGPVVALAAIQALEERAARTGVALAAISNSNHLGMLSYYVERVANRGGICLAVTTSEALVHPFNGRKALIGTNPIALGVPSGPEPFVLDMATAAVSMGLIHAFAQRGEPLEEGWALDGGGEPTTDAVAASGGTIAPFGGAKGYALGLGLELLTSALSGAALGDEVVGTLDSDQACNKGDVFFVVDGSALSATALPAITDYLEQLRDSPPIAGASGVAVPGDRSRAARQTSLADGLKLPREAWQRLLREATSIAEPGV